MKIVFLDSFAADQGRDAWPGLEGLGTPFFHARTSAAELTERCAGANAVITNKVVLSAALMESLPSLRYIGVSATGTNIVEIAAARARGIAVTNVPGYSTDSVAQLVFAMILQLGMDVGGASAHAKAGGWAGQPDFAYFRRSLPELAGKTMVIVGMGAIGRAVARTASAFGMRVVAAAVPGGSVRDRVPLTEALHEADYVSLHCPLTPATANLVDRRFLASLKPGAVLINTARGSLIDEAALLAALAGGRLGGVALDVLLQEPPPRDHPLLDATAPWSDRVLITPHVGWGTVEARARLRTEVVANLRAFLGGERRNRVE